MPVLINPGVDAPGGGQLPTPKPNLSVVGYNTPDASAMAAPGLAEANLGQVIDQAGDAAYGVLKAHQEKVDRIKGDNAVNQLLQQSLELSSGQQGYANQKGPQAVARPGDQPTLLDEYTGKFTSTAAAIRSTLQNDDQKDYFDRHANVASLQFREGLDKHINQQTGQMAIDTYNVGVQLAQNQANVNWNDPGQVGMAMMRIDALAKNRAMVAGYNPDSKEGQDFIKALTLTDNTKVAQEVIQQAVTNKQFVYAKDFFDQHRDVMDAKTADFLQTHLADANQKQMFNGFTTQLEATRGNADGIDKVRSAIVASDLDEQRKNILIHQADTHLDQVQRRNDLQTQRMTNVVTSGLATFSKNADAGYFPTPDQMAPVLAAAHGNPDLEAQVNQFWSRVQETTAFMKMGPAQKQAYITQRESDLKAQGTAMPGDSNSNRAEMDSPEYIKEHEARRVATGNFEQIDKELGGEFGKGNISLNNRKVFVHPTNNGDYSSLESITVDDGPGKYFLLPKVDENGRMMTDKEAIEHARATKQDLGEFKTAEEASKYAIQLERRQQAYYENGPGKAILSEAFKGKQPSQQGNFTGPAVRPELSKFAPLIEKAAADHGVDPKVLSELIWQESRGNVNARSSKGAEGLGQFIPTTAARYGVNVRDAASSINGAAAYLSDNLKQFGGDYDKALAAYNMGENHPALSRGADWLQHAPAETQNYVATIKGQVGTIRSAARQSAADITQINRFKDIASNEQAQLRSDSITYAQRNGWVDPNSPATQTVDFMNPDKIDPKVLAARWGLANALHDQVGAPIKPLTQPEVGVLTSALSGMSDKDMAGVLGAIAKAWGSNTAGYSATMAQIANNNPVVALAGQFAGKTQNSTDPGVIAKSNEALDTSTRLLRGYRMMNPVRQADGTVSKTEQWPMPNEGKMSTTFQGMGEDIFRGRPDVYKATYSSFKAMYADLSAENGKPGEDAGQVNSDRAKDAFQRVTGGLFSFNGRSQVLPWNKDVSQTLDYIDRTIKVWAADGSLPAKFTAQGVRNLPLKQVSDGKYAFDLGDYQLLSTKDKKPLVVDFNTPLFDFNMDDLREKEKLQGIGTTKTARPGFIQGVGPSAMQ